MVVFVSQGLAQRCFKPRAGLAVGLGQANNRSGWTPGRLGQTIKALNVWVGSPQRREVYLTLTRLAATYPLFGSQRNH